MSASRSLWIESTPETTYAALSEGLEVDVGIVGGPSLSHFRRLRYSELDRHVPEHLAPGVFLAEVSYRSKATEGSAETQRARRGSALREAR